MFYNSDLRFWWSYRALTVEQDLRFDGKVVGTHYKIANFGPKNQSGLSARISNGISFGWAIPKHFIDDSRFPSNSSIVTIGDCGFCGQFKYGNLENFHLRHDSSFPIQLRRALWYSSMLFQNWWITHSLLPFRSNWVFVSCYVSKRLKSWENILQNHISHLFLCGAWESTGEKVLVIGFPLSHHPRPSRRPGWFMNGTSPHWGEGERERARPSNVAQTDGDSESIPKPANDILEAPAVRKHFFSASQ